MSIQKLIPEKYPLHPVSRAYFKALHEQQVKNLEEINELKSKIMYACYWDEVYKIKEVYIKIKEAEDAVRLLLENDIPPLIPIYQPLPNNE